MNYLTIFSDAVKIVDTAQDHGANFKSCQHVVSMLWDLTCYAQEVGMPKDILQGLVRGILWDAQKWSRPDPQMLAREEGIAEMGGDERWANG